MLRVCRQGDWVSATLRRAVSGRRRNVAENGARHNSTQLITDVEGNRKQKTITRRGLAWTVKLALIACPVGGSWKENESTGEKTS